MEMRASYASQRSRCGPGGHSAREPRTALRSFLRKEAKIERDKALIEF